MNKDWYKTHKCDKCGQKTLIEDPSRMGGASRFWCENKQRPMNQPAKDTTPHLDPYAEAIDELNKDIKSQLKIDMEELVDNILGSNDGMMAGEAEARAKGLLEAEAKLKTIEAITKRVGEKPPPEYASQFKYKRVLVLNSSNAIYLIRRAIAGRFKL